MDPQPPGLTELARLQAEMERLLRALQHSRATGVRQTTPRPSSYAAGLPRPTSTRRSPLDRLHAHAKAKRTARRRARKSGSLRLDPKQDAWEAEQLAARYPVGYFGPQHGLTPVQAVEANRLLARANRLRPIRGRNAPQRYARRLGGIKSAVLGGRTGNTRWGRSMLGKRGGKVMAMHALSHLRHIAPLGSQAAAEARELRKATAYWERTGEPLSLEQQELVVWPQQERRPQSFLEW